MNDQSLREELDMVEEIRIRGSLREEYLKQRIALRYDAKVIPRKFDIGSLVLKQNLKRSTKGKLASI